MNIVISGNHHRNIKPEELKCGGWYLSTGEPVIVVHKFSEANITPVTDSLYFRAGGVTPYVGHTKYIGPNVRFEEISPHDFTMEIRRIRG
jgi:hypothetical protein